METSADEKVERTFAIRNMPAHLVLQGMQADFQMARIEMASSTRSTKTSRCRAWRRK